MRLDTISISNYRSIKKANNISISNNTVLIGPNNEGKSNILNAIVMSMQILRQHSRLPSYRAAQDPRVRRLSRYRYDDRAGEIFEWERDFPKNLQNLNENGKTEITLGFRLLEKTLIKFEDVIGSRLNGLLPIKITMGRNSDDIKIYVPKKGPGGSKLSAKSNNICKFISDHIEIEHIPAIRTAAKANEIVDDLVRRELYPLRNDPEFKEALRQIERIQKPILDAISSNIATTLKNS